MDTLAQFLSASRRRAGLSLRAVEEATGISNAYLSQLENGKVQEPSPTILSKVADLFLIDYGELLQLVGYPVPRNTNTKPMSSLQQRLGRTTADEEDALVEYLDFLRSRKERRRK